MTPRTECYTDCYTELMRQKKSSSNDKRRIYGWEPSGPIVSMLQAATKGKSRGARSRIIEDALAQYLGPRFPKLMDRYQTMRRVLVDIQAEHDAAEDVSTTSTESGLVQAQ